MADNPVTVNVNGFGRRRSLLATVIGVVAIGYLAALGWTKYGPARPTLDASFARWVDNAAAPIVKNVSGFTAAATPEAMAAEILRIFAREDLPRVGRSARETIPLSWEALIPRVLARYRVVAERVRQERQK